LLITVEIKKRDSLSCKGVSNYDAANMLTEASRSVRVQCLF